MATCAKISFSAETGAAAKTQTSNAALSKEKFGFVTHLHLLPG
jgi:hypothetical protein